MKESIQSLPCLSYVKVFILFVAIVSSLQFSCVSSNKSNTNVSSQNETATNCMDYILAQDSKLGKIRNHACETLSLSTTIHQYVSSVDKLNFNNCPEEFTLAFRKHLGAWKNLDVVTDNYPSLRGEMHDLFDKLKLGDQKEAFELLLKNIWDTWSDLENAKKASLKNKLNQ